METPVSSLRHCSGDLRGVGVRNFASPVNFSKVGKCRAVGRRHNWIRRLWCGRERTWLSMAGLRAMWYRTRRAQRC